MTFRLCKIKITVFCAAVLMLVGSINAVAGSITENTGIGETGIILGDVNSDGLVTISDVTCIQMYVAGVPLNGEFSAEAADVDGDGEINVTDAYYIQRWVALFETPYPIGEALQTPTEPVTEATTQAPTQRPTDEEGWGRDIFRP